MPPGVAGELYLIRAVQPTDPYYLLGWSFGGSPAHEIAVQLQAVGEQVGGLILLDAYPPLPEAAAADAGQQGEQPGAGQESVPGDEADRRAPAPMSPEARMARLMERVREEMGAVLGAISDDEALLLAQTHQENMGLRRAHEFGRFDGDALLFVAAGDRGADADEEENASEPTAERWTPYVSGEISETRLPCTHGNMIQPDMLAQVWTGISGWLGLTSGGAMAD